MSKDQADKSATAAGAGGAVPSGPAPLLRTLGDANAAVCTDGFCEVPQPQDVTRRQEVPRPQDAPRRQDVAPGHMGDDGSHG
jgi:hypothetical protein